MKKIWIGLCLTAAMCLSLAGCAGNKTGGEMNPGGNASPTAQTTPTAVPGGTEGDGVTGGDESFSETNTDAANGGNNVSGAPVGGDDARMGTARSSGRADDSALERMGEGIENTLDDLGNGARAMARDAKRAME